MTNKQIKKLTVENCYDFYEPTSRNSWISAGQTSYKRTYDVVAHNEDGETIAVPHVISFRTPWFEHTPLAIINGYVSKFKYIESITVTESRQHYELDADGDVDFSSPGKLEHLLYIYNTDYANLNKVLQDKDPYKHLWINDRVAYAICLLEKPDADDCMMLGSINGYAPIFDKLVYQNGAKQLMNSSKKRGVSFERQDIKLLGYEMCGYRMFTLSRGDAWITFQNRSENAPMYVKSQFGTVSGLGELVADLVAAWDPKALITDDKVGMF